MNPPPLPPLTEDQHELRYSSSWAAQSKSRISNSDKNAGTRGGGGTLYIPFPWREKDENCKLKLFASVHGERRGGSEKYESRTMVVITCACTLHI